MTKRYETQPPPKRVPKGWDQGFMKSLVNGSYFLWAAFTGGLMRFPTYTMATLPDASENENRIIRITDEAGGYTLAWSDATNWRRTTDNQIVSS